MAATNFKRAPDDPSSDDSRPRWRVGTIRVYRQRSAGFASRAAGSGSATMSRSSITRTPLTRSGRARLTRIGRHGWPAQRVVPVSSGGRIRSTDPGRRTPLRERARGIRITRAIAKFDQGIRLVLVTWPREAVAHPPSARQSPPRRSRPRPARAGCAARVAVPGSHRAPARCRSAPAGG